MRLALPARVVAAAGLLAGATLLSTSPAAADPGSGITPAHMRGIGTASRVVIVAAGSGGTSYAVARDFIRVGSSWRQVRGPMPARIGARGMSYPTSRHEGDLTTPMGSYGFVFGFGSRPDPGMTGYAWHTVVPGICWAGTRVAYNRWVRRSPCAPADEDMWASAGVAYRFGAVIGFNYVHPVFGRGSGIFLHEQTGRATAGCVALREGDLLATLRYLRPGTHIVIGTTAYLRSLRF